MSDRAPRMLAAAIVLLLVASTAAVVSRTSRGRSGLAVAASGGPSRQTAPLETRATFDPAVASPTPSTAARTGVSPTSTSSPTRPEIARATEVIGGPPVPLPSTTIPPVTVPPILATPDRLVLEPAERDGHGGTRSRGIEVVDSDGKNSRMLTSDVNASGLFEWSPGGRYVLSTKQTGSVIDHTEDWHVVAYPTGGGAPVTLARRLLISLSPDGHRLAYSQFHGSPDTRIARVDWTGTPRVDEDSAVTLPGLYSWGSDGTWLLFVKRQHPKDESGDLWRVEADGSGPRQLTANVPVLGAAASPDGTRIAAWVGTSSAECRVALLDAAGGTPTTVGASTGKPGWMGWAHRKNLLVILEQDSPELIVVDGRGAEVIRPQIGDNGRVATHMVAWSRDDDAIYYLAFPPDEAFGFPDVWAVGIETGDARRITHGANVGNIPGVLAR